MSNLTVIEMQGSLVVDSRLIAQDLGIKHKNLFQNIRNHQTAIEYFGQLMFETETVKNSVGASNEQAFCYLNEEQATFVMTLSRNTPKVIKCKQNLVKAFSEAKKLINDKFVPTCQTMALEIERLKAQIIAMEDEREDYGDYIPKKFGVHCIETPKTYVYTLVCKLQDNQYFNLMTYVLPWEIAAETDLQKFSALVQVALAPLYRMVDILNEMSKDFTPCFEPTAYKYKR